MKALLVSFLFISQNAALAQEPVPTSTLETIQIQGHKENKTYNESTESIAVVPSKELDAPNQAESIQALNAVPNVTTNRNDNTFSIRGINNTGVTGYQKDNVSSILVDDVFQTDLAVDAGSFDFWDVHHAEVYRGPQSTTMGVNSLAGSILLYHNKPAEQGEGAFKLGYGNYNRFEVGALTNNTGFEGKVLTRISFNHDQNDGFIKNLKTDNSKWGKRSKDHAALDVIFKLNDFDYIRLNSKLMQTDHGGNYVQSSNAFDYEVNEDVDAIVLSKNLQSSVRYFKKISESWNNEIIAAYSMGTKDAVSDADGTSANSAGERKEDHNDRFVSVENLLKYQEGNIKNVLGFHAHDYYLYDNYAFNILYPVNASTYVPVYVGQTTDKYRTVLAVFDSYLWKFSDRQSVNLGLRYEFTKNKYGASTRASRPASYGAAIDAAIDSRLGAMISDYEDTNTNSVFLPKIAYLFEYEAHTYGVSYTEGYRTGGLSINRARAVTNSYDPEKTGNYELSYKFQSDTFRSSANLFYTKWFDQQVQVKLTNAMYDTQVVNAATSELYGAEAEASWRPATRHELGVGVGYVHTRFEDFTNLDKNYAGHQFPFAPNWTGRASYTHFLNQNWNASGLVRYLSTSYSDVENTLSAPEQFYLDLLAQYTLSSWSLTTDFYVQNVLDTQYVLYEHPSVIGANTVNYNQVNTPREFGFRVSYFW